MSTTLRMLVHASTQGHDPDRLQTRMAEGFTLLLPKLKRQPYLSPRLLRLSQQPVLLKPMEADELLTAIRAVIDKKDVAMSNEFLDLTLIVARLGGIGASIQIGLLAMEELRARRPSPRRKLP